MKRLKRIVYALLAFALGSGALSVHLYSELQAEREARVAAHRLVHEKIPGDREASYWLPNACTFDAVPEIAAERRSGAQIAGESDPVAGPDVWKSGATSAVPREVAHATVTAAVRRLYGGLARELVMAPEQEVDVFDLLIDQQTEQRAVLRKYAGDRTAMSQAMTELRDKNQTALMAALGDKYLAFDGYQQSLGERVQIEQAALQLEAAGVPLREEQRRDLLIVMVEERDRIPRPTWIADAPPEHSIAQQREWQDDYEQRVRSRLSGVLSSDQLKQYDVHHNLQSTLRRRQRDAWRAPG